MAAVRRLFAIATLIALGVSQALYAEDDAATQTLMWPDGTRYVGGVVDGKRSGRGTIFWPDGTRFVGSFKDDLRDGPGSMILPDGRVFNGTFKDDALVGSTTEATEVPDQIERVAAMEPAAPVAEPQVALAATPKPSRETRGARRPTAGINNAVKDELTAAIDAWAGAWSAQDVGGYLSAYAADFAVPGKLTRRAWEGLRRSRLTRPRSIELKIAYEKFEMVDDSVAEVLFRQTYESNLYRDVTAKVLQLKREDGNWRILREGSR